MSNLLLTSVGRRKYIVEYFKEAAENEISIYCINSIKTNALTAGDGYAIAPEIFEKNYIPFVLDFCKKNDISMVTSLFDIDIPKLANSKPLFDEANITLIGPSEHAANIANDKILTHKHLVEIGVSDPLTYQGLKPALQAIEEKKLSFPVIIKPRFGMGSIGVYVADDINELTILFNKCLQAISSSYLKKASNEEKEENVIIQEKIEGQEYGIDAYKDLHNKSIQFVVKKKISMRAGETDIGEVVDPTFFIPTVSKLTESLFFTGIISIDCFKNDSGIYVTEINPRISGHYPFSHLAGVNYPKQLLKWLSGEATNQRLFQASIGCVGSKELYVDVL